MMKKIQANYLAAHALMLGQRHSRWPNIKPRFGWYLVVSAKYML